MASYFDEHELTDRTSNPDFFLELARMLLSPSDILEISRMAFDQIQAPPASKELKVVHVPYVKWNSRLVNLSRNFLVIICSIRVAFCRG
ncbi:hypothetical protein pdam_00002940 [Pocillopora damicornis]|uniref:Uncharacterized protein n=1 Tax=Pocillopora damicornis TaxID=46731 RepID=A0A3M6U8W9_POCDA|nr:hypothetical protein pdam_00002940 [Pocillopora damicornis]